MGAFTHGTRIRIGKTNLPRPWDGLTNDAPPTSPPHLLYNANEGYEAILGS